MILLTEYARRVNRSPRALYAKAIKGGFKTAQKINGHWYIDSDEQYHDDRIKSGQYINWHTTRGKNE